MGEPSTIKNTIVPVLAMIWSMGIVILGLYAIVTYWRLRRKVDTAVLYRGNIFQSENVSSPFVLGIIKPRIYLPFNVDRQDLKHIIAHEKAHIHRKDHWWKPLGFCLLAIHWFNLLMWLAYVLLCRDIEFACDEKVIKNLGNEQRADYTQALVSCSMNRRMVAACPLAFGEIGVKERVKSVMKYKKPTFRIILLSIAICTMVAVCFLTDPKKDDTSEEAIVDHNVENVDTRIDTKETDEFSSVSEEENISKEIVSDIAYHLELSTLGKEFRDADESDTNRLLSEYGQLLDGYSLLARESMDGTAMYVVGAYDGNYKDSPIYAMKSHERSEGNDREYQMLYTEGEEALANEKGADSGVGYVLDDSRISIYKDYGIILIQPENVELHLHNAMSDYLSLGSTYIQDAVSRGVSINVPEEPYLSVYLLSEKYGEITEFIPLNAGQATDIFKGERIDLAEGFGFGAALYMDGEFYYYGGSQNIPQIALDLAVERCGYEFMTPGDIDEEIVEARLDCSWMEKPLYAEEGELEHLREILVNAKFEGVGGCGYGTKLTVTLADGEQLTMFKGTDSCDTMVFGSYGGYTIGRKENTEFWEIFGLDAETRALLLKEADLDKVMNRILESQDLGRALNYEAEIETMAEDAVVRLCTSENGTYEAFGLVSPEYGTAGVVLNYRIDGEDNWNYLYEDWSYNGYMKPTLQEQDEGGILFTFSQGLHG